MSADHEAQISEFRRARHARLTSETGWLTLVARHALQPGANPLPIGTATWGADDVVHLTVPPGVAVTFDGGQVRQMVLRSEREGGPDLVRHQGLIYELVRHGHIAAVRVRDPASPRRREFSGTDWFPVRQELRVEALFEPFEQPRMIEIPYEVGPLLSRSPGELVLGLAGRTFRLDALTDDAQRRLFLVFADQTNGTESYGAGRFLYAPLPPGGGAGKVVIDFNQALSPACAFTEFALCPLPPARNRLPLRIEAGEKRWEGQPPENPVQLRSPRS